MTRDLLSSRSVRALGLRLVRILSIAVLAYVAIAGASAFGRPWLGWTVAASLLSAFLGLSLVQVKRRSHTQREARWEAALYDRSKRAAAAGEIRRALKKLEPVKQRTRKEHARLSVLLAEMLDADGDPQAAMRVVDAVPLTALAALDVGLVRHTRAVTHLRGGDAAGALGALEIRESSGDLELDQRLDLLEAYARIELGEVARGMTRADEIARQPGADESVMLEARVVRAAGLDALGRREEALVVLAALGRESLASLAELGQPRVRELAKRVLEGSAA